MVFPTCELISAGGETGEPLLFEALLLFCGQLASFG
jgi:hypothetical protein